MKNINESEFESEVLNKDSVVFVVFSADWCGPCKVLSPALDLLSSKYGAECFKVNIDSNRSLVTKFNISSIPHVIVFKAGNPVDTMTGFSGKDSLESFVKKNA